MRQQIVLIVEDDDATRQMLVTLVADETGLPVVSARDGQEALDRAHDSPPDVVILDLMLPKMDGPEVARRLRADRRTRGCWIVAITAKGDAQEAFRSGCDQLLLKPLQIDDVLLAVEAAVLRTNPLEVATAEEIELPGLG